MKGVLQMDFCAYQTPVKIVKEGAFEGTYFRFLLAIIYKTKKP